MQIFGREEREDRREFGTDVLDTPVSKTVVAKLRQDDRVALEDADAPLIAVLEAVQEFVDGHEYGEPSQAERERTLGGREEEMESLGAGRTGNAFVDWLWHECGEPSLIEARKVTDSALFFVATEEVWAHVAAELDLSATEVAAARDAHNEYAAANGLAGSIGHSLMAINAPPDRLRRFTSLRYVDDEEYRGATYDGE